MKKGNNYNKDMTLCLRFMDFNGLTFCIASSALFHCRSLSKTARDCRRLFPTVCNCLTLFVAVSDFKRLSNTVCKYKRIYVTV